MQQFINGFQNFVLVTLITDRGTECLNSEMANCCTLFSIRHSPRISYTPWTIGFVEVQNKDPGTHLRVFLHDTPENWCKQIYNFLLMLTILNLCQLCIFLHMK